MSTFVIVSSVLEQLKTGRSFVFEKGEVFEVIIKGFFNKRTFIFTRRQVVFDKIVKHDTEGNLVRNSHLIDILDRVMCLKRKSKKRSVYFILVTHTSVNHICEV